MYTLKFWLKIVLLLLFWGILLPRLAKAQAGATDQTFGGGDGSVTSYFLPNGHAVANSIAVQADGKILVLGGTWVPTAAGTSQIALARYLANGDLDNSFSGDGKLNTQVNGKETYGNAMLVLPNGKILLTGKVSGNNLSAIALFRYNADGSLDNTFDGDGIASTPESSFDRSGLSIAMQADGKIVVGGTVTNGASGNSEIALLRFNANGQLDTGFDGDGMVQTQIGESHAVAYAVMVQPNGKIVAGGYATFGGYKDAVVLRYNSNGTLDNSFSGDGIATTSMATLDDYAYDAALQADGKIVVTGYAHQSGTGYDAIVTFAAARFKTNGTLDQTFSGDGKVSISISGHADGARAVVIQPDGKIILGGYAHSNVNGGADAGIIRLQTSGELDFSFHSDGMTTYPFAIGNSDEIHALALQPDGKLVAAGYALKSNFQCFAVGRFLLGTSVDTTVPNAFSGKASLYPNPVREKATLEYELLNAEKVTINLYDLQGRFIQNVSPAAEKKPGKQVETIQFSPDLPAGTYLLSIESSKGTTIIKAIF